MTSTGERFLGSLAAGLMTAVGAVPVLFVRWVGGLLGVSLAAMVPVLLPGGLDVAPGHG